MIVESYYVYLEKSNSQCLQKVDVLFICIKKSQNDQLRFKGIYLDIVYISRIQCSPALKIKNPLYSIPEIDSKCNYDIILILLNVTFHNLIVSSFRNHID